MHYNVTSPDKFGEFDSERVENILSRLKEGKLRLYSEYVAGTLSITLSRVEDLILLVNLNETYTVIRGVDIVTRGLLSLNGVRLAFELYIKHKGFTDYCATKARESVWQVLNDWDYEKMNHDDLMEWRTNPLDYADSIQNKIHPPELV